jgi:hypothetical protein
MVGVLSFMSFKLIEVDSRTTDNYPNKKRPQKIVISCLEWQGWLFIKVPKRNLYCYNGTNQRRTIMSINVKLSENLVEQARVFGRIEHRSVPKQIEYWSQIGKIAQENPDLPFSLIREILIADQEPVIGEYVFS